MLKKLFNKNTLMFSAFFALGLFVSSEAFAQGVQSGLLPMIQNIFNKLKWFIFIYVAFAILKVGFEIVKAGEVQMDDIGHKVIAYIVGLFIILMAGTIVVLLQAETTATGGDALPSGFSQVISSIMPS